MLSNQEPTQLQEVILRQSPPDLKLNLPLNDLKERYQSGERSFVGEDFNSSDLSGLTLIGCDFRNSNFFQTDLNKCNLDKCDFRGANLREANLRETSLKKADLSGAYLNEADLSGANLSHAILKDTNFQNVKCNRTQIRGITLPNGSKMPVPHLAKGRLDEGDLEKIRNRTLANYKRLAGLIVVSIIVLFLEWVNRTLNLL